MLIRHFNSSYVNVIYAQNCLGNEDSVLFAMILVTGSNLRPDYTVTAIPVSAGGLRGAREILLDVTTPWIREEKRD